MRDDKLETAARSMPFGGFFHVEVPSVGVVVWCYYPSPCPSLLVVMEGIFAKCDGLHCDESH